MNETQKRQILNIRAHFEAQFDECWMKTHTMTPTGWASPEQMENCLKQSYSQGVLKAIDLIMEQLGEHDD